MDTISNSHQRTKSSANSLVEESSSSDVPPDLSLSLGNVANLESRDLSPSKYAVPEWKKILRESVFSAKDISKRFDLDEREVKSVSDRYPAFVNSYYLSLIKDKNDPIYLQAIPSVMEINDDFGFEDPLNEEPEHQARKGVPSLITHRYPDRALFRVSNQCAMYCRFCTRKRKVGDVRKNPTFIEIERGLDYLREHIEIRDVILSGGDPFMLSDSQIDKILSGVYNILKDRPNHIIRIGTRIPCVLPQRVTPELANILEKYHPLFINTHFNHPNEITYESRKACNILLKAGIPLGNQSVLLKGVNDDPIVMKELVQKLVNMRVRPYYLYQADIVLGTNHFRTSVEMGLNIYKSLRGHTSGLAIPNYVIDAPGGGGKIPLLPEYVQSIDGDKVVLKNYEDKIFEYPQIIKDN